MAAWTLPQQQHAETKQLANNLLTKRPSGQSGDGTHRYQLSGGPHSA